MKKTAIKYLFVLQLFVPFAALAQSTVISEKRLTIFTLGDSNGTFPHSWPQQLKLALPNAQVYNISKSGRTIGFLNLGDSTLNSLFVIDRNLKMAAEFVGEKPYDFIVLELGTNDAKAVFGGRQEEVPINLEKLIHKIKGCPYTAINKAKIVIVSPPPYGAKAENTEKYAGGNQRVKAMSEAFKKVALQNDCLFIDGFSIPDFDIETMTNDGLHLDATGSRKLIEPIVAQFLKHSR
ncbi:GDSL-type esterase/lipase family protein [Runella sp.]|uniref:GDSL-type esterase/lipase family protein n=1 Tax=Runella sp. TaxID=1960881 RepID=UPI003D109D94